MRGVVCLLVRLVREDAGQDLIEYALLAGLVGTAGAAVAPPLVAQMSSAYQSWVTNTNAAWEPCAPGSGPCP
jgi:Flp pilus assembly pilin Flp